MGKWEPQKNTVLATNGKMGTHGNSYVFGLYAYVSHLTHGDLSSLRLQSQLVEKKAQMR